MLQTDEKHFKKKKKKDPLHHFGKISFFYSVYTTCLFIMTILSLFCLPYINIILFKKSHFLAIILYPFCLFITGSRLRSLGNIMHECVHNIFLKPKNLNLFFGEICAAFTFSCYSTYKNNHWNHHKYVGIEEKDPDFLELKSLGFKATSQPTLKLFFSIISSFKFYKICTKPVFIQIRTHSLIHCSNFGLRKGASERRVYKCEAHTQATSNAFANQSWSSILITVIKKTTSNSASCFRS